VSSAQWRVEVSWADEVPRRLDDVLGRAEQAGDVRDRHGIAASSSSLAEARPAERRYATTSPGPRTSGRRPSAARPARAAGGRWSAYPWSAASTAGLSLEDLDGLGELGDARGGVGNPVGLDP
jgi:hypothetical protein